MDYIYIKSKNKSISSQDSTQSELNWYQKFVKMDMTWISIFYYDYSEKYEHFNWEMMKYVKD